MEEDNVIEFKGKIRLNVLTPVHIWSGIDLISSIDFCGYENKIYYLRYLDFLKDIIKTAKPHRAEEFKVPCDYFSKYKKYAYEHLEIISETPIGKIGKIKQFMRIGNKRSIPGSSVKGLLRTALLYYIIKTKGMIGIVNSKVHSKLHTLRRSVRKKELKDVGTPVEDEVLRIEIKGKGFKFKVDALNRLLISDPVSEKTEFKVREILAFEIKRGIRRKLTVFAETLEPNSELVYDISLLKRDTFNVVRPSMTRITKLYNLVDVSILKNALKEFSKEVVNYELERVRKIQTLGKYTEFLKDILENIKKNDSAYLKIGLFSGHMFKTIDSLLSNNTYNLLKRIMSKAYKRTWDDLIVRITRYKGDLLGVGWIKITIEK